MGAPAEKSSLPALYQLASMFKEAERVLADLDCDEQTVTDTLEAVRAPLELKARNVAMFILNCAGLADTIKTREAEMAQRRKALERRVESLTAYLKNAMEYTGTLRITSPELELVIRRNPPSVVIENEREIPAEYLIQPPQPPPVPDKRSLGIALKAGKTVPGVRLDDSKTRLEIK